MYLDNTQSCKKWAGKDFYPVNVYYEEHVSFFLIVCNFLLLAFEALSGISVTVR